MRVRKCKTTARNADFASFFEKMQTLLMEKDLSELEIGIIMTIVFSDQDKEKDGQKSEIENRSKFSNEVRGVLRKTKLSEKDIKQIITRIRSHRENKKAVQQSERDQRSQFLEEMQNLLQKSFLSEIEIKLVMTNLRSMQNEYSEKCRKPKEEKEKSQHSNFWQERNFHFCHWISSVLL